MSRDSLTFSKSVKHSDDKRRIVSLLCIQVLLKMFIKSIKRLRASLKNLNKRHAIASLLLKVTNTSMKTEDFQFFWHPGVVQYVRKIYQTAADVLKKVE